MNNPSQTSQPNQPSHSTYADKAVAIFKEGINCSQAVLSSFVEDFGIDKNTALKLAAGFGGGMGRTGHRCGAVTGAYMVVGLKYGATTGQDKAAKELTYQKIREFNERFTAINKSVSCRKLLNCDISTPEGFEEAKQKGLMTTLCPKFVKDAVDILEGIM